MTPIQAPTYNITPCDKLFYQLMHFYPSKAGTSFELIASAVTKIMQKSVTAKHDVKIEGKTTAKHQIDGVVANVAVEAKDHAAGKQEKAVGIGDIRSFEAAICDIEEIEEGKFWTSTRYTKDAKKYAIGLSPENRQKAIQIFQSRPSTDEDRIGRCEKIRLQIVAYFPNDKIQICVQQKEADYLNSLPDDQKVYASVFYDADGNQTRTFDDAISLKYGAGKNVTNGKIKSEEEYIKLENGIFIPIDGFVFDRVICQENIEHTIESKGEPVLLVECEKEKFNKLFTDLDLIREISQMLKNK